MVRSIVWLEKAGQQIVGIFEYLESEAGVKTARRIVRRIHKRPEILARNPLAGPRETLLENLTFEYRYLVEGNYKLIYRVTEKQVIVIAVFDCRRDPETNRNDVKK